LELPILAWCSAKQQYRRFSSDAVDAKEVLALIEHHLMLSIYPRPSVLRVQKLIPARLTLLVLSARLRGSHRKESNGRDQNGYDISSRHDMFSFQFTTTKGVILWPSMARGWPKIGNGSRPIAMAVAGVEVKAAQQQPI
jgi:hypothetical protein